MCVNKLILLPFKLLCWPNEPTAMAYGMACTQLAEFKIFGIFFSVTFHRSTSEPDCVHSNGNQKRINHIMAWYIPESKKKQRQIERDPFQSANDVDDGMQRFGNALCTVKQLYLLIVPYRHHSVIVQCQLMVWQHAG